MYVRIINRFGEVTALQAGSSFVDRFRELVRSGRDLLALSLALNQGIQSESELTSLIFC